jgi:hypothetical protein
MKQIDLSKDSFLYAFKELKNNFFQWIKHYLQSIMIALVLSILFMIFFTLSTQTIVFLIAFLTKSYSSIALEILEYFFKIALALISLATLSYAYVLYVKNALVFYDTKKFSSFFSFPVSISSRLIVFLDLVIFYLFVTPTFMYLVYNFKTLAVVKYIPKSVYAFLMILGIYLLSRFTLSFYIIIDQNKGLIDGLKKSWAITKKYQALFFFQYILWLMLCTVFFIQIFVPLFFLIVRIYLYRTLLAKE